MCVAKVSHNSYAQMSFQGCWIKSLCILLLMTFAGTPAAVTTFWFLAALKNAQFCYWTKYILDFRRSVKLGVCRTFCGQIKYIILKEACQRIGRNMYAPLDRLPSVWYTLFAPKTPSVFSFLPNRWRKLHLDCSFAFFRWSFQMFYAKNSIYFQFSSR